MVRAFQALVLTFATFAAPSVFAHPGEHHALQSSVAMHLMTSVDHVAPWVAAAAALYLVLRRARRSV